MLGREVGGHYLGVTAGGPQPPGRPRVDVGVVTWNTAELTATALRRLLDVESGCDLRLLVRDNASTDGTVEAIRAAVPEAEIEAGAQNLGFAAGVNTLIRRSDAPWFLALNSDAWPQPGAIKRLVDTAESHPGVAVAVPRLVRPDGSLEHSTYPFPSLAVAAIFAAGGPAVVGRRLADRFFLEGGWGHDRPRRVDWAVGAAWLMRRTAIDALGGLDERYFMYAEDVEWCWRARQSGWGVWFDPSAEVVHVGNASGAQRHEDMARRTAAYLRNTYRFYRRAHGPTSTVAYRALNLAAAARLYALFRYRREPEVAAYWRSQWGVHLRPAGGYDG